MTMPFEEFREKYRRVLGRFNLRPRDATIMEEYKGFSAVERLTGCDSDIEVTRTRSGQVEVICAPRYPARRQRKPASSPRRSPR
jgi:hypothetical protein